MLTFEFKKCFTSKKWLFTVLFGLSLSICHVVLNVLPLTKWLNDWQVDFFLTPHSAYLHWIGMDASTIWPTLLFILFPLLTVIPFSDTGYWDRDTGYCNQIVIRGARKDYWFFKYIVCFVSAASVVFITLTFDFLLTAQFLPLVRPEACTLFSGITSLKMWVNLFYQKPFLYVLAYILTDSVFLGGWACLSLGFSHKMNNRAQVLTFPLIAFLILYFVCNWLDINQYSPFAMLLPFQPANGIRISHFLLYLFVLFLLGPIQYWICNIKKDLL